jgi:hypothetical protein
LTTNWVTTTGSAATPWKARTKATAPASTTNYVQLQVSLNSCIQGFEVGVNCAAAAVIMALAGKTSAQGHLVAAVARAFWPRRSSSNRRWLAHEIGQQPVYTIAAKISKRA